MFNEQIPVGHLLLALATSIPKPTISLIFASAPSTFRVHQMTRAASISRIDERIDMTCERRKMCISVFFRKSDFPEKKLCLIFLAGMMSLSKSQPSTYSKWGVVLRIRQMWLSHHHSPETKWPNKQSGKRCATESITMWGNWAQFHEMPPESDDINWHQLTLPSWA